MYALISVNVFLTFLVLFGTIKLFSMEFIPQHYNVNEVSQSFVYLQRFHFTENDSHIDWTVSSYCRANNIRPCKKIFDVAFQYICEYKHLCENARYCISEYVKINKENDKSLKNKPSIMIGADNNLANYKDLSSEQLILVISHYQEDLSWLSSISQNFRFILISKTMQQNQGAIILDKNVGNEVSAYLTYIIRWYDTLPEYSLFLHGHNNHWHQFYSIQFIMDNLNFGDGYQNLNNIAFSPSWRESKMDGLRLLWPSLFLEELGDMPEVFHDRCCAQFIVHRSRIRLRSKAFYERLMNYILTEDSLSSDGYHSDMSFYMEYIWHFIFGEQAVTNCTSDRHFAKFRVDMDHEFGKISYYL